MELVNFRISSLGGADLVVPSADVEPTEEVQLKLAA